MPSSSSSAAKERKEDRTAKKKLSKKLKYSKAFAAIAKSGSASASAASSTTSKNGAETSSKKAKRSTLLDDAYSRAGVNGSDLSAAGKRVFEQALITKSETFFAEIYQQRSFVEARSSPKHHLEWITPEEVVGLIKSGKIGEEGAVMARCKEELEINPFDPKTWERDFKKGFGLRLLQPHVEHAKLWRLCSLLEAYWEVSAGLNVCWVPKGSQPYAPRFDETDAFIMQVSGKSHWTLYSPKGDDTFPVLAVEPSIDFSEDDIFGLKVEREVVLNPGDSLYFPRGFVYFYKAEPEADSLHICISMRTNLVTWADVLGKGLKRAVEIARNANKDLRTCVPREYSSFMGAQFIDRKDDIRRAEFELKALELLRSAVIPAVDIDAACDDLVGAFMYDRLRPAREDDDDDFKGGEGSDDEGADDIDESKLRLQSEVELQVNNAARICVENGMAVVRHCMKNTRLIHEIEDRGIELDLDDAPTVEAILNSNDGPFAIASLPEVLVEDGEEPEEDGGRIRVVSILLHEGILRLVKY